MPDCLKKKELHPCLRQRPSLQSGQVFIIDSAMRKKDTLRTSRWIRNFLAYQRMPTLFVRLWWLRPWAGIFLVSYSAKQNTINLPIAISIITLELKENHHTFDCINAKVT